METQGNILTTNKGVIVIRQCAWCKKILGEIEPLDNHETTHGICEECADRLEREDVEEEQDGQR